MNESLHKRIGIWIRVSTEDQAQSESPEHHEKRSKQYAEARGWEVCQLAAVSGKSDLLHTEAKRMLEDLRSGKITGLIFSKLARLARNTRELFELSDIFCEHDADSISLQAIDTSSPVWHLFFAVVAAMDQWVQEEIAGHMTTSSLSRTVH